MFHDVAVKQRVEFFKCTLSCSDCLVWHDAPSGWPKAGMCLTLSGQSKGWREVRMVLVSQVHVFLLTQVCLFYQQLGN